MPSLRALVFAAALLVVAFLFSILACTAVPDRNALPLLPLFFSLLTPLPFILCSRPQGSFSEESIMDGLGPFLGGAITVSGPAMICVLYHTDSVSFAAFLFSLASELLLLITAYVLASGSLSDADEDYDL